MPKVRRLIETPACRRYVQIEIRDFMMSERELADKYGVPWYPAWLAFGGTFLGLALGMCVGRVV
jgi:hypothetical protein